MRTDALSRSGLSLFSLAALWLAVPGRAGAG
jgi:hypothetical protein